MRLAMDRDAMDAELQPRPDLTENGIGALAAGPAVGNDADGVAALDLSGCKIEDMAEDSANGRAHHVQDAQRGIGGIGHGQNHRSPMTMVSPGLSSVPGGTTACIAPVSPVRVRRMPLRWARGVKPPAIATALSTVRFGT